MGFTLQALSSLYRFDSTNAHQPLILPDEFQAELIRLCCVCQGERSGPSKAAVPSEKQEQEDKVEEGHVQDASTETPETAPWAS